MAAAAPPPSPLPIEADRQARPSGGRSGSQAALFLWSLLPLY